MEERESFGAEAEDGSFDEEELGEDDHREGNMDKNDDVHASPITEEAPVSLCIGFDSECPAGTYATHEEDKEE